MKRLFVLLLTTLVHCSGFCEKVLIITSAYNRPDFIEIQQKTFEKFLKDDYEFVVFNDANQKNLKIAIEQTCSRLGIRCVNIPQSIHDLPYLHRTQSEDFYAPSVRNANVVQYALNNLGFSHNGIVAIVDSDMFLVKNFSIADYLQGSQIAGVPQVRRQDGIVLPYIWIGIVFIDMRQLTEKESLNFNCGEIQGIKVDAGGYTYYYLQNHPRVIPKYLPSVHSMFFSCQSCAKLGEYHCCTHNRKQLLNYGLDETQVHFLQAGLHNVEFFINGIFFHYRSGTNWDQKTQEYHNRKTNLFNAYMSQILKEKQ